MVYLKFNYIFFLYLLKKTCQVIVSELFSVFNLKVENIEIMLFRRMTKCKAKINVIKDT